MTILELFGLLSLVGIGVMLLVLGALSKRLGAATKAGPRYFGFYAAAGFLFASAALQAVNIFARLDGKQRSPESCRSGSSSTASCPP